MTALAKVQALMQWLLDATPAAWRQDPVFRGAAIGVGVTAALLLLQLIGPQGADLQPQTPNLVPAAAPSLPGRAAGPSTSQPPPNQLPRISPGHTLGDVATPAADSDRFGTIKPGIFP